MKVPDLFVGKRFFLGLEILNFLVVDLWKFVVLDTLKVRPLLVNLMDSLIL